MQRNYWDDRRRDDRFEADDDRGWRQRRDDDRRDYYRGEDDDRGGRQRGGFGYGEDFRREGGQMRQDRYRDEWSGREGGQGRGRGGDMPRWGAVYDEAFGGRSQNDRDDDRRYQGGQDRFRQDDWGTGRQGGQQAGGAHRGRGPKGYTRSDDRIKEDVSDRLSDDDMLDASNIEVSVSKREVTLTGTVDSREAKRRAEDCADNVSGVQHVQNNLRVKSGQDSGSDSTSDSSTSSSGKTGRS